jgi:hypothetical protein
MAVVLRLERGIIRGKGQKMAIESLEIAAG